MADEETVRRAVAEVLERVEQLDATTRARIPDRSVSVVVTDLDLAWAGRFGSGELVDVREIPVQDARGAAYRVRADSDVLVDVVDGRLGFGHGWATGQIRVDAGLRDILALRRFL